MAWGEEKVLPPSSLWVSTTVFSGFGSWVPPVNQETNTRPFGVRSRPGIPCQVRFAKSMATGSAAPRVANAPTSRRKSRLKNGMPFFLGFMERVL